MLNTFFIADTHFGHQNIIEYENRPFQTTQEMDETLIANWNRTVQPRDHVFMLGDFAFANKERTHELAARLNGYKILILGNHDRGHSYSWWKTTAFAEVVQYPIIFNEWFILSHEPLYINRNMPYANIFGHVHANPAYADCSAQSFCASVERIAYTPVEFEQIMDRMKAAQVQSNP